MTRPTRQREGENSRWGPRQRIQPVPYAAKDKRATKREAATCAKDQGCPEAPPGADRGRPASRWRRWWAPDPTATRNCVRAGTGHGRPGCSWSSCPWRGLGARCAALAMTCATRPAWLRARTWRPTASQRTSVVSGDAESWQQVQACSLPPC